MPILPKRLLIYRSRSLRGTIVDVSAPPAAAIFENASLAHGDLRYAMGTSDVP